MNDLAHQDPNFKPEEIIGQVTHSSRYGVIVEGENDVAWYRDLESRAFSDVFFLNVGGKAKVLQCYDYAINIAVKGVVCVVDKDLWAIYGVPAKYLGVVTTSGYSIENDILKDSPIHKLFSESDKEGIAKCKVLLSRWFAFHAESYKNKPYSEEAHKYPGVCNLLVQDGDSYKFNEATMERINFKEPPQDIVSFIENDFEMKFRGKSLQELYLKFLRRYNRKSLMEISIKIGDTAMQRELVKRIKDAFAHQGISLENKPTA